MSDIIFALKGRKANLAMKLQSCVKKATCGVDFFSTSQTALDIDRDICWGHFCRWLNHIKTLFTLKKCCDHKAFCKQKRKGYIQVAYENGSDHLVTDLKNNVLTEINGITLCTDPKGKNDAYKNIGEHIYKGNRADSLWGPLLFQ